MQRPPRILIAGGGTGGHVYPAIAIAEAVRHIVPDAAIRFAGTRDRLEWTAVPRAGFEIEPIAISGLHRDRPLRNATLPFKLVRALAESRRLVRRFAPDVAVGTGGYVSGPVLLAAGLAGSPIIIQEQNAYPGLTNRMLARRAVRVHVAFLEAKEYLPPEKCVFSGNPTRPALTAVDRSVARRSYEIPDAVFVLAVIGGSLGSRALNEAVIAIVDGLLADDALFVLWQTGSLYYREMIDRVAVHPRLRVLEYMDHMDWTYAAADLALCRAGAITCSELMVTGTPSILVPSPNVSEDHQTHNARSMANAGAAAMLPESELSARLVDEIQSLRRNPDRLNGMARAARKIARPDAAEQIARDVLQTSRYGLPDDA